MLKFLRDWQARRERSKRDAERLDQEVTAFVADSADGVPSASKYPDAARYRFAWKRAKVLEQIYGERSDSYHVDFYRQVAARIAKAYYAVAPDGPYGKRRLEIQPEAVVKFRDMELARLSMFHCVDCADGATTHGSVAVASPIDCPNCGDRYQSGVYVLSNNAMPGLVKIGFTTKGLRERVDQLSAATAVPVPFAVEAWFPCAPYQAKRHERQLHGELHSRRVRGREFFAIEVSEATRTAERVVGRSPEYRRSITK